MLNDKIMFAYALQDHNDKNDEVYNFCKLHSIEIGWDFSKRLGQSWNEILFDGKLLMQIDQGITIEQFLNVIHILHKDFNEKTFPDNGKDFDFTCQDKKLFTKFAKKHAKALNL